MSNIEYTDVNGNVTVISAGPKGVLSADIVSGSGPHGYSDIDGPTDNNITVDVVNPLNGMPVDKYIGDSHGLHLLSRSAARVSEARVCLIRDKPNGRRSTW